MFTIWAWRRFETDPCCVVSKGCIFSRFYNVAVIKNEISDESSVEAGGGGVVDGEDVRTVTAALEALTEGVDAMRPVKEGEIAELCSGASAMAELTVDAEENAEVLAGTATALL